MSFPNKMLQLYEQIYKYTELIMREGIEIQISKCD